MTVIEELEKAEMASVMARRGVPEFEPGDTIRVHVRVTEGTRTRVQAYEGVCIARKGGGLNESFTVRKISYGEGVERVFQVYSPMIEQIEMVRRGSVRRAKLYYLRGRRGKSARISESTSIRAKRLNDADRRSAASAKANVEAEKAAARQAAEEAKAAAREAEAAEAAAQEAETSGAPAD